MRVIVIVALGLCHLIQASSNDYTSFTLLQSRVEAFLALIPYMYNPDELGAAKRLINADLELMHTLESVSKEKKDEIWLQRACLLNDILEGMTMLIENQRRNVWCQQEILDTRYAKLFELINREMVKLDQIECSRQLCKIEAEVEILVQDLECALGRAKFENSWDNFWATIHLLQDHFQISLNEFVLKNIKMDRLVIEDQYKDYETQDIQFRIRIKECWPRLQLTNYIPYDYAVEDPFEPSKDEDRFNGDIKRAFRQITPVPINVIYSKNAFKYAKQLAIQGEHVLFVNTGDYSHSGDEVLSAFLATANDQARLDVKFKVSTDHYLEILSMNPIELADPKGRGLLEDKDAKVKEEEEGPLMVSFKGYQEMKGRIGLQFKIADELGCQVIVISSKYGSGRKYRNHPINIARSYVSATKKYHKCTVRRVVIVENEYNHAFSVELKQALEDSNKQIRNR